MKKIFLVLSLIIPSVFIAQVQTNGGTTATLGNTNYFLDASGYEGFATSTGKLLGFPRVDLTQFQFNTQIADEEVVLSYFDGSVVYNSGTGNTPIDDGSGNNPSTATAVTPGFYYFSNPDGATNGNITSGVWMPMGGKATLGSISSSELASAVTDETGTGSVVLATSPSLTGTPTVPTASSGDSSSQIANTAFVANAVKSRLSIKTSDYTLNSQDYTVLCNASSATISLTLPSPSESADKIIIIKKIDTSYHPINFSPSVYLTDSETAISINYPKTIKIQSNGTNWYVIN